MIKLGVNIDHIATVRKARGVLYPDPCRAAIMAKAYGANSITIHLREDRRHINDKDLHKIIKLKNIDLNLEIAPTNEMLKIALKTRPKFVCLVPEKRKEITTEGGLNLNKNFPWLKKIIYKLNNKNIRTSIFIEPNVNDIKRSKQLGANCVEIHTGKFCNLINSGKKYTNEINKIKKCVKIADELGLEVHAGHGLNYESTKVIAKIKKIKEFNIGHFIISESIFFGLKKVIGNFKKILK